MRVRRNGLLLAPLTGANKCVVELFAVLHDSCRHNDYHDPEHGPRAAELAYDFYLEGRIPCGLEELNLLTKACEGHTHGDTHTDPTIATCWDADRLDLHRVGITPDPKRLCTDAAREPEMLLKTETWAKYWTWRTAEILDRLELREIA
jgi:uncharacterized protein